MIDTDSVQSFVRELCTFHGLIEMILFSFCAWAIDLSLQDRTKFSSCVSYALFMDWWRWFFSIFVRELCSFHRMIDMDSFQVLFLHELYVFHGLIEMESFSVIWCVSYKPCIEWSIWILISFCAWAMHFMDWSRWILSNFCAWAMNFSWTDRKNSFQFLCMSYPPCMEWSRLPVSRI